MRIRFKKEHPNARMPAKGYPESAGYDAWPVEEGVIPAGGRAVIRLGFSSEFESGYVALLEDRGGMGKSGQTKLGGVVDSDYRGEWLATIYNTTPNGFRYSPNKAIIQILFLKVEELETGGGWVETLSESLRGGNKFGSSDIEVALSLGTKAGIQG